MVVPEAVVLDCELRCSRWIAEKEIGEVIAGEWSVEIEPALRLAEEILYLFVDVPSLRRSSVGERPWSRIHRRGPGNRRPCCATANSRFRTSCQLEPFKIDVGNAVVVVRAGE